MSVLSDELALPKYSEMNSNQVARALNKKEIPALTAISASRIGQYFMLRNVWLDMKRSSSDGAELAFDALDRFDSFDMNITLESKLLTDILDGLVADVEVDKFDQAKMDKIIGWGDINISRAAELGIHVDTSKVQRIRGEV